MALNANKVPVQFRGLETKLDPRQAVIGDLVLLENVRFDAPPKLQKRYGNEELFKAPAGHQIGTFKRELLVGTGSRLLSYAETGLTDKGLLEALTVYSQPITRNNYTQQMPDSATNADGIAVYAWESIEAGVTISRYTVFDGITRQPILSNVRLGTSAVTPKVVNLGPNVLIVYYETTTNRICFISVPPRSPTAVSTPVDVATNPNTTLKMFDVTSTVDRVYVAYATNASKIAVNQIDLTLSVYTAVDIASGITPSALTVFTNEAAIVNSAEDNRYVWIAATSGSGLIRLLSKWNHELTVNIFGIGPVPLGAPASNICGTSVGLEDCVVFYEYPEPVYGSASDQSVEFRYFGPTGTSLNDGVFLKSVGLASKPFTQNGRVHVLTAHQSEDDYTTGLQNTYFLASIDPTDTTVSDPQGAVVGKVAPGIGGGLTRKVGLPEVNAHTPGVFSVAHLQVDRLFSSNGGTYTQTGIQAATFDFRGVQESLEMGDTLLITGGALFMYDGAQVCEHNFHLFPDYISAVTDGGGETSGTYAFCVVYEWMDNYGLVHQSAPSPVETLADVPLGAEFTYTVPTLRLTSKITPVSIVVYRTKANESVMYRVTPVTAPTLNNPLVDTVEIVDTLDDATLGGNPQLIFNPLNNLSEVPPLAMDAPLCLFRYRNRVVVIPSENPGQWMYSKAVNPGVPIEFNPQQFFNPVQGGSTPIVCGLEMDDKNILFASDRIYYTVGDGPAPNGTGNDYGNAYRIPSDVGCSNSASIALTPQGIIFQSEKGIYLLGRDLSVSYIGAPVERYNAIQITSAVLVPGSRRAVFTLAEGNIALSFDYFVQKWSVWTNYGAATATVWNGRYLRLRSDGTVYRETPGFFTDDGSAINIRLRTSWLNFAGLSGFQRVWRFIIAGSYMGPHKLMVSVAFDDNPAAIQNVVVDATTLTNYPNLFGVTTPYGVIPPPTFGEEDVDTSPVADTTLADSDNPGGGAYPSYEWQVKILHQKCTSIQVTITESQWNGIYTEGLDLSSMTFLVGEMPKLHKVPVRRSI